MSRFRRKSRMVEISKSGSGEGLGWETGRGYSTHRVPMLIRGFFVGLSVLEAQLRPDRYRLVR